MSQLRSIHVISSTRVGGAEIMLEKYLARGPVVRDTMVICLTPLGPVGERLQRAGISVTSLGICSPFALLPALFKYLRIVRASRPQQIIAWMYHAAILASIHKMVLNGPPVVWNIRTGLSDYASSGWRRKLLLRAGKWLSPQAATIVYNSNRSRRQHLALGFADLNSRVIYNGFDKAHFRDVPERGEARHRLGIDEKTFLIGLFGRNVAVKRATDAVRLCAALRAAGCPARLLCVGRGYDSADFRQAVTQAGIEGHVICTGEVSDTRPHYAALDLFCICSASEGFPNVVGEAALCGIPIIATDVSDLRETFLEHWQVASVGDVSALAEKALRVFNMDQSARERLTDSQRKTFEARCDLHIVRKELDAAFSPENGGA